MVRKKAINYLNNQELLNEIHRSKLSYFESDDPKYNNYDDIIYDIDILTDEEVCKENTSLSIREYLNQLKQQKIKKLKKENPNTTTLESDIFDSDLVFRLMTYNHIPEDSTWPEDKPKKKASDGFEKVNFPPFQHLVLENGVPKIVGLSHYKNGVFDPNCGRISEKLGMMFMLLVEKISKKGCFRKYSYLDEMKSEALFQLSKVGLQFDEGRGQIPNPFAFYTTVVTNCFSRVLNSEKRNRDIRDDLIEMAGENPSFTRQLENDNWSGGDFEHN